MLMDMVGIWNVTLGTDIIHGGHRSGCGWFSLDYVWKYVDYRTLLLEAIYNSKMLTNLWNVNIRRDV